MVWVKDAASQAPKTVYIAPASASPMARVIHDPNAENPWTVEYAWLSQEGESKADVEALMGL